MLNGERVRLRALEPGDASALHRWHGDAEVTRWLDTSYPESLAQLARRSEERVANSYTRTVLAIETRDEERLIGVLALRDVSPESGSGEVDLYIGEKDAWGRGFGSDALRTLCRFAFDQMRLHSVALWVAAPNAGAIRCYEKVGFRVDGRQREAFRRDGEWHDMLLMTVLEGELR
ncbi:GNAT family N-acetyltransferase [Streptomyces sp. PT12]|uniref:GNAT family N-acetyltransferase n=1 Tax=Streptomyces sp. PT12 TaxID=1510197 RepID=UPI000DE42935|nr:GNAT family protein [Streptomyces sp. PT12]RBM20664.1 RimJ/RimL family protein N-acetyltransferase [Streptomyces sp. PT12]